MSPGYALHGPVAVITLDNPPVNGMNHALRTSIVEGIDRAQADSSVSAIVLTGAGGLFSGGADIREFTTPQARAEPTLPTVIAIVEASA
jgi:3-hydroxyacyl-CoA dehydrogenase